MSYNYIDPYLDEVYNNKNSYKNFKMNILPRNDDWDYTKYEDFSNYTYDNRKEKNEFNNVLIEMIQREAQKKSTEMNSPLQNIVATVMENTVQPLVNVLTPVSPKRSKLDALRKSKTTNLFTPEGFNAYRSENVKRRTLFQGGNEK